MPVDYTILSSGSKGNAVIIQNYILIDCGVSFKMLRPYIRDLKLVLLTHIHSDHFSKATIRRMAKERPALRFGCGEWLVPPLIDCGVKKTQVDVLQDGILYGYGIGNVIPVPLTHNVPNYGYKLHFDVGKIFYATDTGNLNGIAARHYDLYLVEANYEDADIQERIRQKKEQGEYAYEYKAMKNHLSKAQCDAFISANIGPNGQYVYMHRHEGGDGHDHNGQAAAG